MKYCETCQHRTQGTDTHMVCGIRSYVCRVSKTDSCSKHKSIIPRKIYAIQFEDGSFFYGESTNVAPALYVNVKETEADLEWIDEVRWPEIVEVEIKRKSN